MRCACIASVSCAPFASNGKGKCLTANARVAFLHFPTHNRFMAVHSTVVLCELYGRDPRKCFSLMYNADVDGLSRTSDPDFLQTLLRRGEAFVEKMAAIEPDDDLCMRLAAPVPLDAHLQAMAYAELQNRALCDRHRPSVLRAIAANLKGVLDMHGDNGCLVQRVFCAVVNATRIDDDDGDDDDGGGSSATRKSNPLQVLGTQVAITCCKWLCSQMEAEDGCMATVAGVLGPICTVLMNTAGAMQHADYMITLLVPVMVCVRRSPEQVRNMCVQPLFIALSALYKAVHVLRLRPREDAMVMLQAEGAQFCTEVLEDIAGQDCITDMQLVCARHALLALFSMNVEECRHRADIAAVAGKIVLFVQALFDKGQSLDLLQDMCMLGRVALCVVCKARMRLSTDLSFAFQTYLLAGCTQEVMVCVKRALRKVPRRK